MSDQLASEALRASSIQASPTAVTGLAADRRRPGRINYTNPALIAVLRTPASVAGEPITPGEGAEEASAQENAPSALAAVDIEGDGLAAARGIVTGVIAAIPLWAIIGTIIRWMVSHL